MCASTHICVCVYRSINAYMCAYMFFGDAHGVSRGSDQPSSPPPLRLLLLPFSSPPTVSTVFWETHKPHTQSSAARHDPHYRCTRNITLTRTDS